MWYFNSFAVTAVMDALANFIKFSIAILSKGIQKPICLSFSGAHLSR